MSETLLSNSNGCIHFSANKNGNFEYIHMGDGFKLVFTNKVFWNPNYVNADDWAKKEYNQDKFLYTMVIESSNETYIIIRSLPNFNSKLDDYLESIEVDIPYRDEIDECSKMHYKCARVIIKGNATYDGNSIMLIS
jgi:hypothetical protein